MFLKLRKVSFSHLRISQQDLVFVRWLTPSLVEAHSVCEFTRQPRALRGLRKLAQGVCFGEVMAYRMMMKSPNFRITAPSTSSTSSSQMKTWEFMIRPSSRPSQPKLSVSRRGSVFKS